MKHKSKQALLGVALSLFLLSSENSKAQSITYVTVPVRTVDYHAAYVACQDDPNRPAHFRGSGAPGSFEGSAVTVVHSQPARVVYPQPTRVVVPVEYRTWLPGNCSPTPPIYNLVVPQYRTYHVNQKIQNNQYNVQQKNYQTITTNYGNNAKR